MAATTRDAAEREEEEEEEDQTCTHIQKQSLWLPFSAEGVKLNELGQQFKAF
jgi:hypothetical protein